jgi:hypothetical protein
VEAGGARLENGGALCRELLADLKSGVSRGSVYWGDEKGKSSAGGTPAVPDDGQDLSGPRWRTGVNTAGIASGMTAIPCRGISVIRRALRQLGSPMTKHEKRKGVRNLKLAVAVKG